MRFLFVDVSFYFELQTNRLQSLRLVDFQMSRYASPVIDLHTYLFPGTDQQFRSKYYEKLLNTYYSSLSETIKKLGSDPEKLYSYDNFRMELKKFGNFALLYAPEIARIRFAAAEDLRAEYSEETAKVYSQLINDLVNDLTKYDYIKLD